MVEKEKLTVEQRQILNELMAKNYKKLSSEKKILLHELLSQLYAYLSTLKRQYDTTIRGFYRKKVKDHKESIKKIKKELKK